MFVDLDDAVSDFNGIKIHSAGVCDIENPAFDSGQHLVVMEVEVFDRAEMQFNSNFHFRYPRPSSSYREKVLLQKPQLLCRTNEGLLYLSRERGPRIEIEYEEEREDEAVSEAAVAW